MHSSIPLINRPIRTDLAIGEWALACPRCQYESEKCSAAKNQCPDCGHSPLVILSESGLSPKPMRLDE